MRVFILITMVVFVLQAGLADTAQAEDNPSGLRERLRALPANFINRLRANKERWSEHRRTRQFLTLGGRSHIVTADGDVIPLLDDGDEDAAISAMRQRQSGRLLQSIIERRLPFPPKVDHRPSMTAVKRQGNRGTCVAHATVAHLEMRPEMPRNLSRQDAHWVFMQGERRRGFAGTIKERSSPTVLENRGLRTINAPEYLRSQPICTKVHSPYVARAEQLNESHNERPQAAIDHAWYGVSDFEILDRDDVINGGRLARLLAEGHTVVIAVFVAWDEAQVRATGGVVDVVLDEDGEPAERGGGHAMVVVGYDLGRQVFIVRNSWGPTWGDGGYCYMTHDYLRTYGRYGFVVTETFVDLRAPERMGPRRHLVAGTPQEPRAVNSIGLLGIASGR